MPTHFGALEGSGNLAQAGADGRRLEGISIIQNLGKREVLGAGRLMPTNPDFTNEEPASATIRGGLNLVFSTTHPTPKDRTDAF